MNASMYIGRIGGLAVALGVGVAVFTGCDGTAWAKGDSSHSTDSASQSPHPTAKPAAATHPKPKGDAAASTHSTTATAITPVAAVPVVAQSVAAQTPSKQPKSSPAPTAATPTVHTAAAVATAAAAPSSTSAATPATSTTTTPATATAGSVSVPAGDAPTTPADASAVVALAAVTRQKSAAAAPAVPAITVSPTLSVDDGIIEGSAGAVDSKGNKLTYTIIKAPSLGGKITFDPELASGDFTYLPNYSVLTSGSETFKEMVSETTAFDKALESIPLLGGVVPMILLQLHENAGLSSFLAPLIGSATVVTFNADPSALNTHNEPLAFTYKVKSFDGTLISTNFFPAENLDTTDPASTTAPTVLEGPGLGSNGLTDPFSTTGIDDVPGLVPGVSILRDAGYNVVTWDPRGEGASGGTLQLDNPNFEGKDVSAILDFVQQKLPENNNRFGMVGGSYGGGIQLATATIDNRIDAIVPGIAWNTLNASLYPAGTFKTSWATLLILNLVEAGARINPEIYGGILTGFLTSYLTAQQQALLKASGTGTAAGTITVPTLLLQGTADGLFPLQQAITNEELLSKAGTTVKEVWFCGGHGVCLDPIDQAAQTALLTTDTLDWLNQYVALDNTTAASDLPNFQWVDQAGNTYSSNEFPESASFQGTPVTASLKNGGTMPIIPILGGAGPSPKVGGSFTGALVATATAAPASNAINLKVAVQGGTQIVGAPTVTFTYSGLGNGRDIYGQIVDDQTGLVLGNIDTPIPVILDGRTRTVTVSLNDIAYTAAAAGGLLTLQLVGSATQYQNFSSVGAIHVSNLTVSLPTVGTGVATEEDPTPLAV